MTTTLDHLEPKVNCVYLMEFRNDFSGTTKHFTLFNISNYHITIILSIFSYTPFANHI